VGEKYMKNKLQLFEQQKVRMVWDEENEKWWFSVVDVVAVLTESDNPQVYWRVLKKRLADKENQTVTNCNGLKMLAPDGKMRLTDVADTEQILRLIQSIPSKKAEPFKMWLAKVCNGPRLSSCAQVGNESRLSSRVSSSRLSSCAKSQDPDTTLRLYYA
jgi:prophage antirepressor-like protein